MNRKNYKGVLPTILILGILLVGLLSACSDSSGSGNPLSSKEEEKVVNAVRELDAWDTYAEWVLGEATYSGCIEEYDAVDKCMVHLTYIAKKRIKYDALNVYVVVQIGGEPDHSLKKDIQSYELSKKKTI